MSGRNRILIAALSMLACCIAGCGKSDNAASTSPTTAPSPSRTYTIAVIPKGSTHVYWRSVKAGAEAAAADLGAQIIFKGPVVENDRDSQIDIVEQFASQGVDAIVLAPLDNVALKPSVDEAMARHIPVVIIDSSLDGDVGKDYVSFCATDNHRGGEIAGDELARLLGGKGKVVLLRYDIGSASTIDREAGFLDAMSRNPGIQLIVKNRYAGPTISSAEDVAMQLADPLQHCDGIFASNESACSGMLLALRQLGLAGKVKYVGFDTSAMLLDALKAGEINALVAQNPRKMAFLGVQQAINALHGWPTAPRIDSGAALITAQNINDPALQEYLEVK